MFNQAISPNINPAFYPERSDSPPSPLDEFVRNSLGYGLRRLKISTGKFAEFATLVNENTDNFNKLDKVQLGEELANLRLELRTTPAVIGVVARSFALIREYSERFLGMRHFDVQLIGGWVIYNGMIAEMETGEGKTLTATLPAITAALAGIPVHIITVNDYLAQRDGTWMKPLYEAMGISLGIINHGMTIEQRKKAYNCDVTYCTNKELVFDYLKDHLAATRKSGGLIQMSLRKLTDGEDPRSHQCLRGLCFAIVDEADSVLIDEARTPLIISGAGDNSFEAPVYRQAMEFTGKLETGVDFRIDTVKRSISLSEEGKLKLETLTEESSGFWRSKVRRELMMRQALTAAHLFHRGKDYLVKDGKVQIIDEYTGRLMADRSWEQGLHQLIECKEGCEITPQKETLARISYQRFFRRYHRISGMTGTAREVSKELWDVYRLGVVAVPTNKTLCREAFNSLVFKHEKDKLETIIARIKKIHEQGRPVLVGTPSVKASDKISSMLESEKLPHRVLNAQQDKEEAEIIAEAGRKHQITVATNMAGRGTDIKLSAGVAELGGLHVIATERHNARRIDRQLFGRCGRQGDPGSFEIMASLEDEIMKDMMGSTLLAWLAGYLKTEKKFGKSLYLFLVDHAQKSIEKKHYSIRRDLLKYDESLEKSLAFSGRGE